MAKVKSEAAELARVDEELADIRAALADVSAEAGRLERRRPTSAPARNKRTDELSPADYKAALLAVAARRSELELKLHPLEEQRAALSGSALTERFGPDAAALNERLSDHDAKLWAWMQEGETLLAAIQEAAEARTRLHEDIRRAASAEGIPRAEAPLVRRPAVPPALATALKAALRARRSADRRREHPPTYRPSPDWSGSVRVRDARKQEPARAVGPQDNALVVSKYGMYSR
jgi:hypothetical protein